VLLQIGFSPALADILTQPSLCFGYPKQSEVPKIT
jgi:hypothetical protein